MDVDGEMSKYSFEKFWKNKLKATEIMLQKKQVIFMKYRIIMIEAMFMVETMSSTLIHNKKDRNSISRSVRGSFVIE